MTDPGEFKENKNPIKNHLKLENPLISIVTQKAKSLKNQAYIRANS
jgi:hypothetical protein